MALKWAHEEPENRFTVNVLAVVIAAFIGFVTGYHMGSSRTIFNQDDLRPHSAGVLND